MFTNLSVKTLKPVVSSSQNGFPLKFEKRTWRQYNPSVHDRLSLISTPLRIRWTIPLI
jgi:hypothetical protein